MTGFQDAFISYGRADSKAFATQLYDRLLLQGLEIWFDQHDIPLGVDYQNQIDEGIEKAHNFLFIIAPHSVNSPYCGKEINLAIRRNKRIIPLLHVEQISYATWQQRYPNGTASDWEAYQAKGLHSSFPNMHPTIGKINWVYFREGVDDFEQSFAGLLEIFERQRHYVTQHTYFLARALEWERHHKESRYLLVGEERMAGEQWLKIRFEREQAPCEPTDLHCEFICESIQNANNLMTQVFLCHSEQDKALTVTLAKRLMRERITVWTSSVDIKTGAEFQQEINRGIEQADNLVYLISRSSLQSAYCQQEITYALALNKRIVPLLVEKIDLEEIPVGLRSLQFIDFTGYSEEGDRLAVDKLLNTLDTDAPYHEQHKILLTQALKWDRQNRNSSILLRGYNLNHAEAWLKIAKQRADYPPTPLQIEFISESLKQPPNLALEVFISYSRTDSDFARKLNDALQIQGKTTWFDQESIASGTDFQQEIYRGIETSDNFLFILSPISVNSPYCADEVGYAAKLNKRIVTVLHRPVDPATLPAALSSVQWIDFNRHNGDFYANFNELVRTLDTDRGHVRNHTKWSLRSLEWQDKGKNPDLLLRGTEFVIAETWLQDAQEHRKQPPATDLQKEFIHASQRAIAAERRRDKIRIWILRTLLASVSVALVIAVAQWRRAKVVQESQINALSRYSQALSTSQQELHALIEAIRAARQLQQQSVTPATYNNVLKSLQTALFEISESNQLAGHPLAILDLSFSPDGEQIVTASWDKTAKLWNTQGQVLAIFTGHTEPVSSVAFSPDQKKLVTGSYDYTAKLWDLDGKELQTFKGHQNFIYDVSFSPDGKTLATASADWTVKLWSLDGKELQTLSGFAAPINSVTFSPDGKLIATASGDGTVWLWTSDGQPVRTFQAHQDTVWDVEFSPDGQRLATASADDTAKLWNLEGKALHTLEGHTDDVKSISFSWDGQRIATTSWDNTLKLWTVEGEALRTFAGHQDDLSTAAFSPDGQTIATASFDNTVKLWHYLPPTIQTLEGHQDAVNSLSFSPDGTDLATASADGTVKLWDRAGQILQTLDVQSGNIWDVTFSPDGERLATAGSDGTVKLWNRQGQVLHTLQEHAYDVSSVNFSPDGKRLATASYDGTAKIWTLDGKVLQTLKGHRDVLYAVQFSPDGTRLATASFDKTVKLWDLAGRELLTLKHDFSVSSLSFSPDGQLLATASEDNRIRLWNRQGEWVRTLEQSSAPTSVSFSPDGKFIVAGGWDHTVTLWTVEGQKLQTLQGHDEMISRIIFSPDGRSLASASQDHSVRLWSLDLSTLEASATLWTADIQNLLVPACDWVRDYLTHNPNVAESDRHLCDGI
jgi:WD40 repeat protein